METEKEKVNSDTAVNETIIELDNVVLEDNESEKNKDTVNIDVEAKQPIPANNRQVKTAKGTEDEEAGVDVRVMDNLIEVKTSDLTGIKNDGAHDGVEDRAVGSRRRKMGHQIDLLDHGPYRALSSGEGPPAHTPPPKD